MAREKHEDLLAVVRPARPVELRTDTMQRRVTLVRCLKSVTWPSPRCGLAIFVRVAAPCAREENDARENAKNRG